MQREISALCTRHGVDEAAICRELCMSWDELKPFADDPLVTIGAHTITHCNLAKADEAIASHEMAASRARIEDALQRPVLHLAYPYGDKIAAGAREFALAQAAGFKTAVTTRPGMIFPENAEHLTALPRVSLNGNYQDEPHLAGADLRRRHRDVERFSPRSTRRSSSSRRRRAHTPRPIGWT